MKGIMFRPDMIQAIIEGRKTQTRRLAGLEYINKDPNRWLGVKRISWRGWTFLCPEGNRLAKPRYQVGETVYIKEAFMFKKGADIRESYIGTPDEACLGFPPHYLYKADDTEEVKDYGRCYKWRSPMMMPEHAARHFITITVVRAERLQEITEADCIAEGCPHALIILPTVPMREWFKHLWNSINPKYPWESNPWVFAYTFRRAE